MPDPIIHSGIPSSRSSASASFRRRTRLAIIAKKAAGFITQEALRQRLDRRAVAQVLEPLFSGDPDALLLLLDVRHLERCPPPDGRAKGSRASPYAPGVDEEQRARERAARREAREERRRAQGRPLFPVEPARRRPAESVRPRAVRAPGDGAVRDRGYELQSGLPEPELGAAPPDDGQHRRLARLDRHLRDRDRPLARARARARDGRRLLLRRRGPINAFTVAFQIPNLIRALVADAALSSAFVPVFSDLLEKGERRRAWRVASSLF